MAATRKKLKNGQLQKPGIIEKTAKSENPSFPGNLVSFLRYPEIPIFYIPSLYEFLNSMIFLKRC